MSGLREQVATALWNSIDDKGIKGRLYQEDCDYLAEIAVKVTERAVRDTIAQQLEATKNRYGRDRQIAMLAAARIAREGTIP